MGFYPNWWTTHETTTLTVHDRGRLVKDRKSGKAKMSCRNWECGVVVPVRRGSHQGSNLGKVPVPMQVPGRAYRSDEEPWFYDGA